MTTYNTGNPVGSVDVRDLYDNAENLDKFTNGPLDAYPDRFGVSRQSWAGMEAEFDADQVGRAAQWAAFLLASGYQVLGPYGAGLVFTAPNQLFSYLGEFYAPGPSITLPYTTTGEGAAEIANFRSVGDAVLRQDLANTAADLGASIIAGGFRVVGSIAALRLLLKTTASKNAFVTGYYGQGDGGGGQYYLDSADTTSADNGGTIIVAADGGRWKITTPNDVNVLQFGCKPDGVTMCTARLAAIRDYAATRSSAGNAVRVTFPTGRYIYTESPNWAINRLHLNFEGEVWLVNEGADSSFVLDGGAVGSGVYGIQITGVPLIYGDAGSAHGVYMRAIYKSDLRFNVRGAGPAYAGLYMEWGVSNNIYYTINANEGGLYSTPARGIHLTLRGGAEESSYNLFHNVECTGVPVGIYQDAALGNLFIGGAVQGCTNVGLQQTVNAWENKFIGTDFEVNTVRDAECAARESQFIGCDFEKGVVFQSSAVNCSVIGGASEQITVESGAIRTLYSGVTYNRFGAGVITDAGTSTRFRDIRNKGAGEISNVPRARTVITVGASPFTYTNSTGNQQTILVTGGTVSQVAFIRFAGELVPVSGFVDLSPGDSVSVTYSSVPSMVLYTR